MREKKTYSHHKSTKSEASENIVPNLRKQLPRCRSNASNSTNGTGTTSEKTNETFSLVHSEGAVEDYTSEPWSEDSEYITEHNTKNPTGLMREENDEGDNTKTLPRCQKTKPATAYYVNFFSCGFSHDFSRGTFFIIAAVLCALYLAVSPGIDDCFSRFQVKKTEKKDYSKRNDDSEKDTVSSPTADDIIQEISRVMDEDTSENSVASGRNNASGVGKLVSPFTEDDMEKTNLSDTEDTNTSGMGKLRFDENEIEQNFQKNTIVENSDEIENLVDDEDIIAATSVPSVSGFNNFKLDLEGAGYGIAIGDEEEKTGVQNQSQTEGTESGSSGSSTQLPHSGMRLNPPNQNLKNTLTVSDEYSSELPEDAVHLVGEEDSKKQTEDEKGSGLQLEKGRTLTERYLQDAYDNANPSYLTGAEKMFAKTKDANSSDFVLKKSDIKYKFDMYGNRIPVENEADGLDIFAIRRAESNIFMKHGNQDGYLSSAYRTVMAWAEFMNTADSCVIVCCFNFMGHHRDLCLCRCMLEAVMRLTGYEWVNNFQNIRYTGWGDV